MKRFFITLLVIVIVSIGILWTLRNKERSWTPEWEESIETFQPTEKIMNIIGVKPGLEIGEIGGGNGRFAVRLAKRVGETGKVYANDIDLKAVRFMRQRIKNENITNMQIILSQATNPHFPKNNLDLICVINSYENFSDPVRLLSNSRSSLRVNGKLAIVAFSPEKTNKKKNNSVEKKVLIEQVTAAGYQLIKIDSTSLAYDNVYVFSKGESIN